jgi:hypothetical protein
MSRARVHLILNKPSSSGSWIRSTGCLRWRDERPLTGACKGTSGGKAVLISGSSNGNRMPTYSVSLNFSFPMSVSE